MPPSQKGSLSGQASALISVAFALSYFFHGNRSIVFSGAKPSRWEFFKNPIIKMRSRSCGAPNDKALTSRSVKTYPAFRNLVFSSSKNARCFVVRYNPLTFSKRKKSGFRRQISSIYVPDSFPFSPCRPLFFPPTEKSGHGGPPIKPTGAAPFCADSTKLCIRLNFSPSKSHAMSAIL